MSRSAGSFAVVLSQLFLSWDRGRRLIRSLVVATIFLTCPGRLVFAVDDAPPIEGRAV